MTPSTRFLLAATTALLVTISFALVDAISLFGGVASDGAVKYPKIFIRDVLVSNTDRHLQDTDSLANSEPGIAINPRHPNQIVISAFSGGWALPNGSFSHSPLWYSKSGGAVWTKVFSIPRPNNVSGTAASPCDQTFDFDRRGNLYGTFLVDPAGTPGECSTLRATVDEETPSNTIYTGVTTDPAKPSKWKWLLDQSGKAQPTGPQTGVDQAWLIVTPDVKKHSKDKIYVAYQGTACAGLPLTSDMRVATADATVPPDFLVDESAGCSHPGALNPGHRGAGNPRTGAVYILYQNPIGTCDTPNRLNGIELEYRLNSSVDGGQSWSFGNQPLGTVVAQACSNQNFTGYSFGVPDPGNPAGGVNLLKGGVDTLAVDPKTGAVYVVYGAFDSEAERDQLKIVQVTSTGGAVEVSSPVLLSPADQQAALPAVAVTENGTIGVLYDTADGLVADSDVPTFSAHLAVSHDHGRSFLDTVILHFQSPIQSTFDVRILGDYQQLKAVGNTFYGVFSGNGHDLPPPFNRKTDAIDPIFFKTTVR
jgi:hypothetical protein